MKNTQTLHGSNSSELSSLNHLHLFTSLRQTTLAQQQPTTERPERHVTPSPAPKSPTAGSHRPDPPRHTFLLPFSLSPSSALSRRRTPVEREGHAAMSTAMHGLHTS
jgi:hypothetical protein